MEMEGGRSIPIQQPPQKHTHTQNTRHSVEALAAHRATELHELAESRERRLSFCRLCRKQFTSPDQLKGHLLVRFYILFLREGVSDQIDILSLCVYVGRACVLCGAARRGGDGVEE